MSELWMVSTVHLPGETGFSVPGSDDWVWVRGCTADDGAWVEYAAIQRLRQRELRECGCYDCLEELQAYGAFAKFMPMRSL